MPLWYRFLAGAGLLLAAPWYLLRRGKEAWEIYRARAYRSASAKRGPRSLWIHAVSVGEVGVAATFARVLPQELPLLVTTVTPTGQLRARQLLGNRAQVAYLPLECQGAVERFYEREQPRALILVEGDFWPLVLEAATQRKIPIAAINVRLSDRTFRRLLTLKSLAFRYLFSPIERFGVQSELDRERLLGLGVPPDRMTVTGNLKYDAPEASPLPELEEQVRNLAAGRPILIAGSTMPEEEPLVAKAFQSATAQHPAFLLLAPRHPERASAVEASVEKLGLRLVRRSQLGHTSGGGLDGLLLDSVGELASLYRTGLAAFVGGTLVPRGGHNPLEPARAGVAIAVGPSLYNFRDLAVAFDRDGAWVRVRDEKELGEVWRRWLQDPKAAQLQGERGRAHVRRGEGAITRTLEFLQPLLDRAFEAGRSP